jgi:Tol biopolymer transport system component
MLGAVALAASLIVVVVGKPAQASFPGPNGAIAFESNRDGNFEIYAGDDAPESATNKPRRLTNNPKADRWPSWSEDGKKIAFASRRDEDSGTVKRDLCNGC